MTNTQPTVESGDALIGEIVRRILSVATPEKTILFASAATGEMTRDSDIDLLIVESDPGDRRGGIVSVYNERTILSALERFGYPRREVRTFANDGCRGASSRVGGLSATARSTRYGRCRMPRASGRIRSNGLLSTRSRIPREAAAASAG